MTQQKKPNRLSGYIAIGSLCVFHGIVHAQEAAVQSARTIGNVQDVIDQYDPNQHLYVKGEVGAAPQQLADLEKWLDENGPHWTIVLMKNAQGETYHAQDGRSFRDMDAVEFAMGHGLANRTPFGTLEHPQTGETDGAVFVLFLEERKFSYYGSDAHDRRSMGESHWIGNLDRQARSAMQNGGRIIDAVKNTVSDINLRLKQSIDSEEQAEQDRQELAQRQQLERERAVETLRQRIAQTETDLIPELEKTVASFKQQFPDAATSSLATPPFSDWQLALKNAAANVNEANVRDTSQNVEKTIHEIHRMIDLHAAHRAFDQSLAPAKRRWENMTFHSFGHVADSYSKEAEKLMDLSRKQHVAGDLKFAETLQKSVQIVGQGETAVLNAVEADQIAQSRRRLVRRTIWIAGGVVGLIGLFGLVVMNWRRRSALLAAYEVFDKSGELIGHNRGLLEAVLSRRQQITGTLDEFRGRGFTGSTLQLAELIDRQCQTLTRISGEADRVLNQATRLLNPYNPLAEAANMVSRSRYYACSRLLAGKSMNSSVINNLPQSGTGENWVTLEDFLARSNAAISETNGLIDAMADALMNTTGRMESMGNSASELAVLQQGLETQSDQDGHFPVPALENVLLPAIHQTQSQVEGLLTTDPVRVVEEFLPVGTQQIENGLRIARSIRRMRDDLFSKLDTASDSMKSLGHRVQWIGDRVSQLGSDADQLCILATRQDVAAQAGDFDNAVSATAQRAIRCAELAAASQRHRSKDLVSSLANITTARTNVSGHLRVATGSAIVEAGHNPDDNLKNADSHLVAAAAAIDFGNVDAAQQSVDACARELAKANRIVSDTLTAMEKYSLTLTKVRSHLQKCDAELPRVSVTVKSSAQKYSASAMGLRPASAPDVDDSLVENGSLGSAETIQSHLESGRQLAIAAKESIDSAEGLQKNARVLEAAFLMETTEISLSQIDQLNAEIDSHCQRLDSTTQKNIRSASEVSDSVAGLGSQVADSRCEQSTMESHQELMAGIAALTMQLQASSGGRDPFQDESQLQKFRMAIASLSATIQADYAAHSQAVLAIQGAAEELAAVQRLASQSVNDKIPDSSTTTQCQSDAKRLEQALHAVKKQLERPHGDWQPVQAEASSLTADLGIVAGTLVRELQLAEQSAADFRQASGAVFRAARWTGLHGVAVTGEPGSEELQRARQALSSGDYSGAIDLCRVAASLALRAIEIAEAAVERRQRQIAAEAERRRRRMESSSSSIFGSSGSSSSGFSFGSSSRSSGSSWSSGSSSSSSRSSGGGSGFSRSGW